MLKIEISLESPELEQAIVNFEDINGKIQDTIPVFVSALINFSHEILGVEEIFYGRDDRAATIFELIGEDSIPNYLRYQYEDVCDRLHDIDGNDEIWKLIEAIVRAVVAEDDRLLSNGKLTVN